MIARYGRTLLIAVPLAWLLLFFLLPFAIVLKISLAEAVIAMPPYTPAFRDGSLALNAESYRFLLSDALYLSAYVNSVKIALGATLLCLLLAYPMAYGIARASSAWRLPLLLLVILPFWTSFLLRVYAWMGILRGEGLINNGLLALGLIDSPLVLLQTDFAVYLGIVYSYLPFMILPLYAALEGIDERLLEAAADLGARPAAVFIRVTLPLSLPGVVAGSLLVFIPAVGEFVIPTLLGGPDTLMIGRVLWDEFFANRDWPVASAVAICLLLLLVVPLVLLQHFHTRRGMHA